MLRIISILIFSTLLFSSCLVSKKKYQAAQTMAMQALEETKAAQAKCDEEKATAAAALKKSEQSVRDLENQLLVTDANFKNAQNKANELNNQLEYFKSTNTELLGRLADLSVVNITGAESIKKSLEALGAQNKYIQNLNESIQRKDSLNLALVTNLKRSLENINDEDIQIEVKKGVVYVSLSDKLLFKSGSYEINKRAEEVLSKIAKVVNDHKELDILVEGHTDNVPIKNDCMKDNWDLSVMRSTAVVKLLQTKYGVAPNRMTAGGRSEFIPKANNTTAEGRSTNRRTEIIITPKLDQFLELLTTPEKK